MKVRIKKAPKMQRGGTPIDANMEVGPTGFPSPDSQYWKQHPLITEHSDGTIRHWGEAFNTSAAKPQFPQTQLQEVPMFNNYPSQLQLSNKAMGYDNNYYPSNGQRTTKTPDTIHSNIYAYGGQLGYSLDLGRNKYTQANGDSTSNLAKTIQPALPGGANIEAELHEQVAADFNGDGSTELLAVGGKRHSQGGTPLNVPQDAFVFSDTQKMKMGGPETIPFGKTNSKQYTPADLAKQYDINKYKAIIDDPKSDSLQKRTAELMVQNYETKLGQLALVQEAKKGFPTGIPDLAMNYLQQFQAPSVPQGGNIQQQTPNTTPGSMKYGGFFQDGGGTDLVDPYYGAKTSAGATTPTGKNNAYNRSPEYLNKWESLIPGVSKMNNKAAQSAIYDYTLKNNPDAVKNMWSTYGLTHKGLVDPNTSHIGVGGKLGQSDLTPDNLSKLKSAYTDGYFGARQLDPISLTTPQGNIPGRDQIDMTAPASVFPGATLNDKPLFRSNPNQYSQVPGDMNPQPGAKVPFDYMTPDKNTMNQAVFNRASLHKYMPWEAPVNAYTPNPTFYDPSRELASNEEQQNSQNQYASEFSGPQSFSARASGIAGNAAGNAANILAKYNAENVGVANQFAGMDTDIMNKLSAEKTNAENNLYAGNTIANQSFDNSRMKLDNELLGAKNNAWNNRAELNSLNMNSPYFYTDPSTGQRVFKGGKNLGAPGESQKSGYTMEDYPALIRNYTSKGMTQAQAHDLATRIILGDRDKTTYKGLNQIPTQTVRSGYEGLAGAAQTYPQ